MDLDVDRNPDKIIKGDGTEFSEGDSSENTGTLIYAPEKDVDFRALKRGLSQLIPEGWTGSRTLCDFSRCSLRSLSSEDIDMIIDAAKKNMRGFFQGRVAILVSDIISLGMARMFEIRYELDFPDVQIQVFPERIAAEAWLNMGIN